MSHDRLRIPINMIQASWIMFIALSCEGMILSENRYPLFGIMP